LETKDYKNELTSFLTKNFVPAGYKITQNVELDLVPENSKYDALTFALNDKKMVYRKGKVTPDRPGAFLAIWQRPSDLVLSPLMSNSTGNKPVPLTANELDYLFIKVHSHSPEANDQLLGTDTKQGMFIFPVSVLIAKGIIYTEKSKGKTGFRVFPPWSEDRGVVGTKVFSESGKKTQRWQLPYFIDIDDDGLINPIELNKLLKNI